MQHMQEEEFDTIKRTTDYKNCQHDVVSLYELGSNVEYGCTRCKVRSTVLEHFVIKN